MDVAIYRYLLPFVGGHEGKVLKAYLDPVHVITIGYGFTWGSKVFRAWWGEHRATGKLKLGDTMTEAEAFEVLQKVLANEYVPPTEKKFNGQPSTLVAAGSSMTYNCGLGALSWDWANLIANGRKAEGIKRWRTTGTTARGKKLPGLVRRRGEEADIAATGKWPDWVQPWNVGEIPATHTAQTDIAQAQKWLETLGYAPGPADGIPGQRTVAATLRFQKDHGQLTEDGIIGPATLSALQRAVSLRTKGLVTGGVTGTAVAGGAVEGGSGVGDAVPLPDSPLPVHNLGWIGDVLLWGGLTVGIAVLVYFAWRYKDEIIPALKRIA